jgi:hypothetical protein
MVEFDNMNWSMCENKHVIDVKKRGRSQDITKTGKLVLSEPVLTE